MFHNKKKLSKENDEKFILLERFAYSPMGTFSKLTFDDFFCYAVEQRWRDNERNISCIPEGMYNLEWYDSPTHGKTLILSGGTVSKFDQGDGKRYGILFHVANTMDDLKGCIGLGSSLGYLKNRWAVTRSKNTTEAFLEYMQLENNLPKLKIKQYLPKTI